MFKRGTTSSDRPRQDSQKTTNSQNASLQGSQEDSSSSSTASSVKQIDCNVVVKTEDQESDKAESVTVAVLECAVCLQSCVHPVKLPCSHIFCYLCVKGVAFQSKRCAMCRQEIPSDFLLYPQLLDRGQLEKDTALDDGYQWFYEGRNGWWQYDERTSVELETAYKRSQRSCELLIAGFLYVIDFDQMLQYRRTDPSRRRRIKRDLASIPKKGVAGLRLEQNEVDSTEESGNPTLDLLSVAASRAALNSNNCLSPGQTQTPQAPSNTPQTPQTPRSPPSPAPEPAVDVLTSSQGSQIESEIANYSPRWQEPERRRLRRAMEEIERLRLNDTDTLTTPRLDHMVVYYNFDDRDIIDNQDLWPSEETSSDEEGNGI